jgi:hypothetical protein
MVKWAYSGLERKAGNLGYRRVVLFLCALTDQVLEDYQLDMAIHPNVYTYHTSF